MTLLHVRAEHLETRWRILTKLNILKTQNMEWAIYIFWEIWMFVYNAIYINTCFLFQTAIGHYGHSSVSVVQFVETVTLYDTVLARVLLQRTVAKFARGIQSRDFRVITERIMSNRKTLTYFYFVCSASINIVY